MIALGLGSCGAEDDYKNELRPASPINITASISDEEISVSPAKFGAGPIVLIMTNQSDTSQEVTFETDATVTNVQTPGIEQSTAPINPQDTATLKIDVKEGRYQVRVGSTLIRPARIEVGAPRPSAQNEVLQP